jgi:hypothetical protein
MRANPACAARNRPHPAHTLAGPGGNKPGSVCGGLEACGATFAGHPTMRNLIGVCTLPVDHDGPHDNLLPKVGP